MHNERDMGIAEVHVSVIVPAKHFAFYLVNPIP